MVSDIICDWFSAIYKSFPLEMFFHWVCQWEFNISRVQNKDLGLHFVLSSEYALKKTKTYHDDGLVLFLSTNCAY